MPMPSDAYSDRAARDELVELRAGVDCRVVLDAAGWEQDDKESKRCGDDIWRLVSEL